MLKTVSLIFLFCISLYIQALLLYYKEWLILYYKGLFEASSAHLVPQK